MIEFEQLRRHLLGRLAPLEKLHLEPGRIPQAAVTLLLRAESNDAEVLVIKRAEREGDPWSGHLALPGGRAQPDDSDLLETAIRETWEEIGIDLRREAEFLGRLPIIAPRNTRLPRIEITPLVAVTTEETFPGLSPEVVSTMWLSVSDLKRGGLSETYAVRFGEAIRKWPAYPTQAGPVWGITERILTNFLSLI